MRKPNANLHVDWVELGCRGWEIDATGAEAAFLDPTETMGCHLDRETLDIILCGSPEWCASRIQDLADVGVGRLAAFGAWRIVTPTIGVTAGKEPPQ